MTDVFEEINDDLRRQKLNQFWKENGSWIIGGAIGAVLLTGILTIYRQWEQSRDTTSTAELMRVISAGDMAKLEGFAATSDKNHAMMARFLAAAAHVDKKEYDKAIALYDAIAQTSGLEGSWRDLARIRSISLRLDKDKPEALMKEIEPLTGAKNVWRHSAMELQALLAAREGQMQKAADIMSAIAADPLAPDDARQRALGLHALYAADAKNNSKS